MDGCWLIKCSFETNETKCKLLGSLWRFSCSVGVFLISKIWYMLLASPSKLCGKQFSSWDTFTLTVETWSYLFWRSKGRMLSWRCEMALELILLNSELGWAISNREYQNLNIIFEVVLCSDMFTYAWIAVIFPCRFHILGGKEANKWKQDVLTDVFFDLRSCFSAVKEQSFAVLAQIY